MENSSQVTSFILAAYTEMEDLKYFYVAVFLLSYVIIVFGNLVLIAVIFVERSLHEPMFFFLCTLVLNGLYGSTALFPSLMGNMLSQVREVSRACCLAQVFCLHTYGNAEFTILALMAYDRYVAICRPLHYKNIMSPSKVYKLIIFSCVYPILSFSIFFIGTLQLPLCGRVIERLYCLNYSLVKLSCVDTTLYNIAGQISIIIFTLPQLLMILYSYTQILRICLHSSRESKIKALKTCSPHLLALLNYSVGALFELYQTRFSMSHVPHGVRILLSLYFLIIPPMLNPVIYGISIQAIRVKVRKILHPNKITIFLLEKKMEKRNVIDT
ncbi:olfactory receptor 52K2-like [Lepisosteus oculatus]